MKAIQLIAIFILLGAGTTKAQKIDTLYVETSAQCGMCEETLESNLRFEKGIKYAELNMNNMVLKVVYKTRKTNPDKIRHAIAGLGYDADDVPADPEAYENLHGCCKKPDDPNREEHNH